MQTVGQCSKPKMKTILLMYSIFKRFRVNRGILGYFNCHGLLRIKLLYLNVLVATYILFKKQISPMVLHNINGNRVVKYRVRLKENVSGSPT